MDVQTVKLLIEKLGLPIAMVLFFIWLEIKRRKQDEKREAEEVQAKQNLVNRLAKVEDYQRDKMEQMVVENTTALQNNADATKELSSTAKQQSQVHKQLIVALRTRPCLQETVQEIEGQT
jgi:hypothetical protein